MTGALSRPLSATIQHCYSIGVGMKTDIICSACTASPKPKCRRCYRLRWDAANKERNAEVRRERYLRTRPKDLPFRRRPNLARVEQGVVRVPVKGWGCIA
jgi:hypothetical protein